MEFFANRGNIMKKKLLALLCVLSVLVGVLALSATAATPEEEYFMVGYSKVDINPYYVDGDYSSGVMPVPLRGLGSPSTRLAYKYMMDDNGDGKVNQDDGLKLTCIAITDSHNNTILMFTMDAIGDMGHTALARESIVKELGAKYGITADRIMVSGTHGHSSVDLTSLTKTLYQDTVADVDVKETADSDPIKVSGRTAFECLNAWRERLTGYKKIVEATEKNGKYTYTKFEDQYTNSNNYFIQAAEAALKDRAVATISKGQIEANQSGVANGDKMNFVRHYVSRDKANGNHYVMDSYSNKDVAGTLQGHIAEADQTLHAITFNFEGSTKQPIVLVNWRNHPQFSSGTAKYVVSSDYISAFRYQMGQAAYGGYRAAFFQGTGGNTQPTSRINSENWTSSGITGVHQYGKAVADITKVCLNKNMKTVAAGEVKTMQNIYAANRVVYSDVKYAAALAALAQNTYPFTYTSNGETVVISCDSQASKIKEHYNNQSKVTIDIEIDTILIGPEIAIVTCPGEPFDRYSLQAAAEVKALWNDDSTPVTYAEYYAIANKYNDWDNLAKVANAQYGEPLIFGYTNQHVTYIPNALAYNYNAEHPELYSTNSYGSFMTPLAEGEGERMVANLATMLDHLVNNEEAKCTHCNRNKIWRDLSAEGITDNYDHYYLSDDLSTTQNSINSSKSVCLNLNGHTLSNSIGTTAARVFALKANATVNIMDLNAQDGRIVGSCTGSGGAISAEAGSVINMYGGTLSATKTTAYGGVIWTKGTVNIYGGTVEAGDAKNTGDAICLHNATAALNVYGGEIIKNVNGDCVSFRADSGTSVADVVIQVGGNAVVGEIAYLQSVVPTVDTFKIVDSPVDDNSKTPFTGSVTLNASGITHGAFVGRSSVPLGRGAFITTSNGFDVEMNQNNQLVAVEGVSNEAGVVLNGEITSYSTLAEAIANVGEGYVILGKDIDTLAINKNITIDLNGRCINNVTVAEGFKLTLMDNKTEDFYIGDQIYGVVKKISGNVVAAKNYLAVTDEEGTSYHAYEMKLDKVTLRPGKTGMYYTAGFDGDAMVVSQIDSFGTALRLGKAPDANSMTRGQYSAFAPEEYGAVQAKSTILVDIMKATNVIATNKQNAETEIYGSAYIKLKDGSYLFSTAEHYSLKTLTEEVSKTYSVDVLKGNADLMELYRKYSAVMSDWNIQNIKDAYAEIQREEDETLKILLIGNSHSLDSFHMLYDVIEAEGIPEDNAYGAKRVELGVLYFGGCRMRKHAEHARGDVAAYDFYRVGPSTNGEWVETPDTTLKTGLKAERWDVVVFQEMNMEEGLFVDSSTSVAVNSTKYVYDYVRNTLGYKPEFMWNMIWSNPTIPDCCDTTNYTTDAQYQTKWIYKIARPAYAGQLDGYYSWEDRAMAFYGNDPQSQYNQTVEYLQNEIIGRFGISSAEKVVTPGTTMMYALYQQTLTGDTYNLLANEQFAYRDYTHLSDVSRVMVAYLWYAELFGLDQVDSMEYTTIPAAMRAKDKTADIVLDANMQKNILDAVNYTLSNPFGAYTGK